MRDALSTMPVFVSQVKKIGGYVLCTVQSSAFAEEKVQVSMFFVLCHCARIFVFVRCCVPVSFLSYFFMHVGCLIKWLFKFFQVVMKFFKSFCCCSAMSLCCKWF